MKTASLLLAPPAILAGCLLLLPPLARAGLQDPRLGAADYVLAFLRTLLGSPAALVGAALAVLGLAAALHATLIADGDRRERGEARPAFWAALAVGAAALFALLLGVNYLSLQAGEVAPISARLWR